MQDRILDPGQIDVDKLLPEPSFGRVVWRHLAAHCYEVVSLVVLVALVYWPAVGFDFVNWDDPWYIINNSQITSWAPSNLYSIATEMSVKNYAPLTTVSFLLDHTLWGLNPQGFHLTNIWLHALNGVLVFFLTRQLTGSRFVAWITAMLFAVHPIQIETVAWISSRKGLLSGAFILATLICWLRPERTARQEGIGLLFFSAALLSKAIAVVVPFVVLTYDLVVRREPLEKALPRQVIPGFLSILLLLVTMSAQQTEIGGMRGHLSLSKLDILAVDAVILWKYVGMLAWPSKLCVLYSPPTSGIAAQVLLAVAGWMLVVWTGIRFGRQRPLALWAGIAFISFLVPVLNLFPITTLMNDRYLYLPTIPLFALFAAGIERLNGVFQRRCNLPDVARSALWRESLLGLVAFCTVVSYAEVSRGHLPVWRDGLSLWTHAYENRPELCVVRIQMANTLYSAGDRAKAIAVLRQTLRECRPDELDRNRIDAKIAAWSGETDP